MKNNYLVQNNALEGGVTLSKINPSCFSYALK